MTFPNRTSKLFTSLVLLAFSACTAPESSPTALTPSDDALAAKPAASPYTYQDLGTVDGMSDLVGYDVNNEGVVAVSAVSDNGSRGYLLLAGQLVPLTETDDSHVSGISNGDPMYAVGRAPVDGAVRSVRWTVTGGVIGAPVPSPVADGAWKVNDLGNSVGGRYIWRLDNTVEEVLPPGDFQYIDGSAIDDAGLTLFNAMVSPTLPDRAYLRLTDGALIRLDPPAGRPSFSTTAGGLTEPDGNNLVHVAGTIRDGATRYPARWTVNVATRQATIVVESRTGFATDVSSGGTRVGGSGGWESDAYAWRLDGTKFKLPAPRGAQDAGAYAISDNGMFVTGSYYPSRGNRRALLWSGNGP